MSATLQESGPDADVCPGLFDEAGAVRSVCRTCGKCEDLILAFDALADDSCRASFREDTREAAAIRAAS